MATKIQIKRTNTGNIPQTVNAGELVYVAHSAGTNANSPNKDKLFIGSVDAQDYICLLYTSPSPRDRTRSRMPSSA